MSGLNDPVLDALDALEGALDANLERTRLIKERIVHVREARANGLSYAEIGAMDDPSQAIVRLVTESATALDTFGVRLRRLAALHLYEEGMTMEQIGDVFGVTRQRVSALLKISDQ